MTMSPVRSAPTAPPNLHRAHPPEEAFAAIALLAALAGSAARSGALEPAVRPPLERAFAPLDGTARAAVEQRVTRGTTTLATEVAALEDRDDAERVYALALAVCEADGPLDGDELRFLERLRRFANLPRARAGRLRRKQRRALAR